MYKLFRIKIIVVGLKARGKDHIKKMLDLIEKTND